MKEVELHLNLDGDQIKICRRPDPSRPCVVSCRISTAAFSRLMSMSTSIMIPYSSLASALLMRSIDILYESLMKCPHQLAIQINEVDNLQGDLDTQAEFDR